MVKLALNRHKFNNYDFFCPVSKLHLTVSNPVGYTNEVTPAILKAIKAKTVLDVDGVINLISMSVINEFGDRYSHTTVSQETTEYDGKGADYKSVIDLAATDGVLYNEGDTMMEILYPEEDIRVRVKER